MHILITGGSRGIGLAIAKRFAAAKHSPMRISVCSRNAEDIAGVTAQLCQVFPDISVFARPCDVSKEEDVHRFVDEAREAFGSIDVLVNNAGFGIFQPVEKMTVEEFDAVIATNLRGVFLMSQAVLPRMIRRHSGTIVTICSVAGKRGYPQGGAYCTSKFGVRGLMQSLWLEAREHGIRVMTVMPGNVDTEFFERADRPMGERAALALHSEDVADAVYAAVMLPGRATISELEIVPTDPMR
jgi:NAD(P)-dependent dehydrogenase (short-subunit alcohol dehydrogenase family)